MELVSFPSRYRSPSTVASCTCFYLPLTKNRLCICSDLFLQQLTTREILAQDVCLKCEDGGWRDASDGEVTCFQLWRHDFDFQALQDGRREFSQVVFGYLHKRHSTYIYTVHLPCAGRHTHACAHTQTHRVHFYSVKMWSFHVSLIYFSKIVFCLQTPFVLPTVKGKNPWCWFYFENYFDGCSVLFSTLSLKNRVFTQKGVQSLARWKELRSSYNSFAS